MGNEIDWSSDLEQFKAQGFIQHVDCTIKSGKEATVFRCLAGHSLKDSFVAAKVYRPVQSRSFKNDAMYQFGRVILDSRDRRAVKNKSQRGKRVQFDSWIDHEYEVLTILYSAGAWVPRPIAKSGNTILMEYIGKNETAASMLYSAELSFLGAQNAFNDIIANIELFLACNIIHADLSAYNILVAPDQLVIIDFPQAVDARFNSNAYALLQRDVQNVGLFFSKHGVYSDCQAICSRLWNSFVRAELCGRSR